MGCSLPGSSVRGIFQAFPSPGDLPDPGIEPGSPAFQADALTPEPPGKPTKVSKGSEEELMLMFWIFIFKYSIAFNLPQI